MKKLVFGLAVLLFVNSTTFAESKKSQIVVEDFYCTVYDNYYTSDGVFIGTVTRDAEAGEDCGQSNNIVLRKMK